MNDLTKAILAKTAKKGLKKAWKIITFRMLAPDAEAFRAWCKKNDRTESEVIRELIQALIK